MHSIDLKRVQDKVISKMSAQELKHDVDIVLKDSVEDIMAEWYVWRGEYRNIRGFYNYETNTIFLHKYYSEKVAGHEFCHFYLCQRGIIDQHPIIWRLGY